MPSTTKSEDQKFTENLSETTIKKEYEKTETIKTTTSSQKKQNGVKTEEDDKSCKKSETSKKKTKTKKSKKAETDTHISVKSSFSKFDALQKRSLIHNPQGEVPKNCHVCDKPVYKMEEIKAEKHNYHKNCFRCHECNKQLKVDTYQSHEGVLYCTVHFKLLFAPKSVEDNDVSQPRKPELIIRENQPTELPPDVIRASDKPNLGLEELQQLNVRSRFQVFEQGNLNGSEETAKDVERNSNNVVKRSATILSKVAKLEQLSSSPNKQRDLSSSSDNDDELDDDSNADFIRQDKLDNREIPVGIGEAMNDIRTLFEKGHGMKKEERREERKQEIQNIRSRLFMGKQARIKEMYQQAVAESESASDKKSNIEVEVDSKSLRERFENGEVFRENQAANENDGDNSRKPAIEKEADVFESAISKKSRSIFMELDANVVTDKNKNLLPIISNNRTQTQKQKPNGSSVNECDADVVKCGEAVEDVKIETSEISEKFKFFEKYHPTETKRKAFRITPPREGVVKMPSPDEIENVKDDSPERNIIAHSKTTSMMLNKFRELENNQHRCDDRSPKPLKCFTPPPDGNRRLYAEQESDEFASNDDDDDEEEDGTSLEEGDDDENNCSHLPKNDEALREAQNAARAKQLRLKFEKWQANEIKREMQDEINQNKSVITDENSIESTQLIRERFEKMRSVGNNSQSTRPRHQVNRFV